MYGYFTFIIMSLNGQYQMVCDELGPEFAGGMIYVSNNYGYTWNCIGNTASHSWTYLALSSSGKYGLVLITQGKYFTTIDYENTWNIGSNIIANTMSTATFILYGTISIYYYN